MKGLLVRNAGKRGGIPARVGWIYVCVFRQVRGQQPGAAGRRRLHDRLPERSDSPQEDARHRLAEEMLPDDRQKVRRTPRF